jgi:redox-sensitive bicupin YhaK (pirin superfamily)
MWKLKKKKTRVNSLNSCYMQWELDEISKNRVYTLSGNTIFSSGGVSRPIEQYHNVVFEQSGDSIEASVEEGAETESRFILVAGLPLDQPIVQYGPFVVTSRDEVMQAMRDYQTHLNGFERAYNWESVIRKSMAY